jgi:hypothetical protein
VALPVKTCDATVRLHPATNGDKTCCEWEADMASTIKGPAIFLAQFAGEAAPFNSWGAITKWAGSLGYKGVQVPTWDGRLFDLGKAAESKSYCDDLTGVAAENGVVITELSTHLQGQLVAVNPAYDAAFDANGSGVTTNWQQWFGWADIDVAPGHQFAAVGDTGKARGNQVSEPTAEVPQRSRGYQLVREGDWWYEWHRGLILVDWGGGFQFLE